MDCSQPGSSVHGILQARILEWASISFSRGSSRPRNRTQLSHSLGRCFNLWATREALELSIVVHFSYQHQNCFLKYIKPEHKNWGSTRCSVTTQRSGMQLRGAGFGGRSKREWTYVYLRLIQVVVWQKPTQHCKAIILLLKNKLKKKLVLSTQDII